MKLILAAVTFSLALSLNSSDGFAGRCKVPPKTVKTCDCLFSDLEFRFDPYDQVVVCNKILKLARNALNLCRLRLAYVTVVGGPPEEKRFILKSGNTEIGRGTFDATRKEPVVTNFNAKGKPE